MEKLPNKDIERMITFIKHEAEEKVKEIEIRAIQEYNTEKARLIKQEIDNVERSFTNKQKHLEVKKLKSESNIINKYKLLFVHEKEKIILEIFSELENISRNQILSAELINETVEKMNKKDFFVMCCEKDKKIVKKVLGNVEIRDLCESALGGIILISADKKTIIDNSYKTRIDSIKKYYCSELVNLIFN